MKPNDPDRVDLSSINKTKKQFKLPSLTNPFKKQVGPRRDQEGKFATGSGGLRLKKKLSWKLYASIILVFGLIGGGALVYKSHAADDHPFLFHADQIIGGTYHTKANGYPFRNIKDASPDHTQSVQSFITVDQYKNSYEICAHYLAGKGMMYLSVEGVVVDPSLRSSIQNAKLLDGTSSGNICIPHDLIVSTAPNPSKPIIVQVVIVSSSNVSPYPSSETYANIDTIYGTYGNRDAGSSCGLTLTNSLATWTTKNVPTGSTATLSRPGGTSTPGLPTTGTRSIGPPANATTTYTLTIYDSAKAVVTSCTATVTTGTTTTTPVTPPVTPPATCPTGQTYLTTPTGHVCEAPAGSSATCRIVPESGVYTAHPGDIVTMHWTVYEAAPGFDIIRSEWNGTRPIAYPNLTSSVNGWQAYPNDPAHVYDKDGTITDTIPATATVGHTYYYIGNAKDNFNSHQGDTNWPPGSVANCGASITVVAN